MKHNIVWFDVPVLDLDRAIRFYSAVLNAEVKKEDAGDMTLAMLPTPEGGQMGCLCVVEGFKPSADGIMIYFGVNGRLKAAVAAVRANGGTVQSDVLDRALRLPRRSAGFRRQLHRAAFRD